MNEDPGFERERRKRSVALGLVLAGLAVLFFVMSIVQWSEHVHH